MEPISLIAIAGWLLIGIAILVAKLPIGRCDQCDHCRAERTRTEWERANERETDLRRLYGVSRCPRCGQYHRIGGPC